MEFPEVKKKADIGLTQLSVLSQVLHDVSKKKLMLGDSLQFASSSIMSLCNEDAGLNSVLVEYSQSLQYHSNAYANDTSNIEVEVLEALEVFKNSYKTILEKVFSSINQIILTIKTSNIRNQKIKKSILSIISQMDEIFIIFERNRRHCPQEIINQLIDIIYIHFE